MFTTIRIVLLVCMALAIAHKSMFAIPLAIAYFGLFYWQWKNHEF